MKLNPEGVEKAARAMYEHDADDSGWPVSWEGLDEMDEPHIKQKVYLRQATAALTAYFDHLRESGRMKGAMGLFIVPDKVDWVAASGPTTGDFPAFIIKQEE